MDLSSYLNPILLTVITALVGFVVKFVFSYVHALTVNKKFISFAETAKLAVQTAEQVYQNPKSGDSKFTYASSALVKFAKDKFKVDLNEAEVKLFIESAVNELVSDVHKELDKPVEEVKPTEEATK
jgi:hypothetical protein